MLARKLVPSLSTNVFIDFLRTEHPVIFLIVRHPYDRLLSAYRDKFENKKKYYHKNYGNFMINQYRQRGMRRFGKKFYTYDSFGKIDTPHLKAAVRRKDDPTPTFWEFVRTIIDHGVTNEHWLPISFLCSLCKVSTWVNLYLMVIDLLRIVVTKNNF